MHCRVLPRMPSMGPADSDSANDAPNRHQLQNLRPTRCPWHTFPEGCWYALVHALQIPVAVPRPPISPGDLKRLNVVAPGGSPYLSTSALSLSSDWRTGPPAPDGPTYFTSRKHKFPCYGQHSLARRGARWSTYCSFLGSRRARGILYPDMRARRAASAAPQADRTQRVGGACLSDVTRNPTRHSDTRGYRLS